MVLVGGIVWTHALGSSIVITYHIIWDGYGVVKQSLRKAMSIIVGMYIAGGAILGFLITKAKEL